MSSPSHLTFSCFICFVTFCFANRMRPRKYLMEDHRRCLYPLTTVSNIVSVTCICFAENKCITLLCHFWEMVSNKNHTREWTNDRVCFKYHSGCYLAILTFVLALRLAQEFFNASQTCPATFQPGGARFDLLKVVAQESVLVTEWLQRMLYGRNCWRFGSSWQVFVWTWWKVTRGKVPIHHLRDTLFDSQ